MRVLRCESSVGGTSSRNQNGGWTDLSNSRSALRMTGSRSSRAISAVYDVYSFHLDEEQFATLAASNVAAILQGYPAWQKPDISGFLTGDFPPFAASVVNTAEVGYPVVD